MGQRIETHACYLMGRMIETDSLYPNPIYPNNFLKADLNILAFPTLLVSIRLKCGMFRTWNLSKRRCNESWDNLFSGRIVTWDITLFGAFYHMIFQKLGHIALGRVITLTFCSGTLRRCVS